MTSSPRPCRRPRPSVATTAPHPIASHPTASHPTAPSQRRASRLLDAPTDAIPGGPDEVDLTDPAAVRGLLRFALPPLRGDAAALLIPASDARSQGGVLCLVEDMPERPEWRDVHTCVSTFAQAALLAPGDPGLLVAVQRRGEAGPRESDACWVGAARSACAELSVAVLGVWLSVERRAPVRLDAPLPGAARLVA